MEEKSIPVMVDKIKGVGVIKFKSLRPYLLLVDDAKFAEDLDAFSVHPSLDFVDQRFVDDAHTRGLQVYVYTANLPEDIAKMHQLGIDGVFTDFPERVVENYAQGGHNNQMDRTRTLAGHLES